MSAGISLGAPPWFTDDEWQKLRAQYFEERREQEHRRHLALTTELGVGDISSIARGRDSELPTCDHLRTVLASPGGTRRFRREVCRGHCSRERWGTWCVRINRNGDRIAVLLCLVCGSSMKHIGAHKVVDDPSLLPVYRDNRIPEPCMRCLSMDGIEWHHYLPRSWSTKCEEYGTVPLCKPCHNEIHREYELYITSRVDEALQALHRKSA